MNYAQPDFYRFTTDSIELAKVAAAHTTPAAKKILELGAGCGVVSCEFAQRVSHQLEIHLCEKQRDYESYLEQNFTALSQLRANFTHHFHFVPWDQLRESSFDVILSNPPYFLAGRGRVGADERREIARRWDHQERDLFYRLMINRCANKGLIALTLRDQPPDFFLKRVKLLEEVVLHARTEVLTRIFVFTLNVEANEALF